MVKSCDWTVPDLTSSRASQQFFKEANDTYVTLQKEHETVRKKFTCNKNTSLEDLLELLRGLEVRLLVHACST